jgi:hypothetical protein
MGKPRGLRRGWKFNTDRENRPTGSTLGYFHEVKASFPERSEVGGGVPLRVVNPPELLPP